MRPSLKNVTVLLTAYIKTVWRKRRLGNGILLLSKAVNRWAGLFAALDQFPRDFHVRRAQRQKPVRAMQRVR